MYPTKILRSQSVYSQSGFLSGLCVFVGNSIETDTLSESLIIQEFVSVIFDVKPSGMIFLEISLYTA